MINRYIRLITRVSVRYGERNISLSQLTSVISALFLEAWFISIRKTHRRGVNMDVILSSLSLMAVSVLALVRE